ncbi:MAG: hypothetical protein LBH31_01580 [Burkholderiaceae bacterium]|jgi:hypothetical protein|nr:hypothetical protein [Burkholderiaceae bacterium]
MTENELTHEASKEAVKKVLAMLGVDAENPREVEEFREDLRFGRRLRKASSQGFVALIGIFAMGVGAVVWEGILSKLGHK